MAKYTKIVIKTYISILLEFNCVTQFDMCCNDWDKVTVKFVMCSDNILIYAVQKWEQFSQVYGLSLKKKRF